MRNAAWVATLFIGGAISLQAASPAAADVTGSCNGTASFLEGTDDDGPFTIDAATVGDETIVVPRSDTVSWTGSVAGPPGEYSGSVSIDFPPLFPDITIDSWSGDSETTSNEGIEEYDLPGVLPAGVTFTVNGEHVDDNGTCTGFVNVELEGGPFDSPVAPVSLVLTGLSGVGLAAAARPLFRRVA
jgi:hypothetical protein